MNARGRDENIQTTTHSDAKRMRTCDKTWSLQDSGTRLDEPRSWALHPCPSDSMNTCVLANMGAASRATPRQKLVEFHHRGERAAPDKRSIMARAPTYQLVRYMPCGGKYDGRTAGEGGREHSVRRHVWGDVFMGQPFPRPSPTPPAGTHPAQRSGHGGHY
jgi:hypothetical protein